jgi:replication factor A1
MKIDELEPNSALKNLVVSIDSLELPQDAGESKIQEGIVSDDTGQVRISLWNDQVDKFKEGDKVLITTGWCKEFKEELQISSGKFGEIKLVPK